MLNKFRLELGMGLLAGGLLFFAGVSLQVLAAVLAVLVIIGIYIRLLARFIGH